MKLVLATSNKGKVREITAMYSDFEVIPFSDLIETFEIAYEPDLRYEDPLSPRLNIDSPPLHLSLTETGFQTNRCKK